MNDTTDQMSQWQQNKAKWEQLCKEQESIYRPEFEQVFTKLFELYPDQREVYNTHLCNVGQPLPEATDTNKIDQALQAVGASDEVAEGFKQYAEVTLQGKQLMQQNALLNMAMEMAKRPQETHREGWRFYPINFIAPPQFHSIIVEVLQQDAQKGEGLFTNITEIAELPDEALDEWLGVEVYNVVCSLQPYHGILSQYGVTGQTLGKEFTRYLFKYLKQVADYIKDNTDRPQAAKKQIYEAIKNLDGIKVWGLIFQILTLQGLLHLLENCTLKEAENGYKEAQDLCNWIADLLIKKLIWFTMIGAVYGDEDKKRLQPLCDYLYNTELGRAVQEAVFRDKNPEAADHNEQTDTAEGLRLPDDLNEQTDTPPPGTSADRVNLPEFAKIIDTPEMRKAQEMGLIDEQYKWLKGLQMLACFAREMSLKYKLSNAQNANGTPRVNWQIFERLFDIQRGKLRQNYNDIQKTGQQPRDSYLIDTLFK